MDRDCRELALFKAVMPSVTQENTTMNVKWSSLLTKEKLSGIVVDDAVKEAEGKISAEMIELLQTEMSEKKQISELKK